MNKLISAMVGVVLFVQCSCAGNPPDAVTKAFTQKFPTATNIKWGKENATEWEADFKLGDVAMSANFSQDGTWVETETEISAAQLPTNISDTIHKKYDGWEILDASKVENAKDGTNYEVDIKSGSKKKEVVVSADGNISN